MKNLFNKSTKKELIETSEDLAKNIKVIEAKINDAISAKLSSMGRVKREEVEQSNLGSKINSLEAEKNQAVGVKRLIDEQLEGLA